MKRGDDFGKPQVVPDQDSCAPMLGTNLFAGDTTDNTMPENFYGDPDMDVNKGIINTLISPP